MDTLPQEALKFSHERGYQNSLGFPTILQFSLWVGSQKKHLSFLRCGLFWDLVGW